MKCQQDKYQFLQIHDYKAKENKDRFAADKAEYIHQNLDREKWSHMLNTELFESFVSFFQESI